MFIGNYVEATNSLKDVLEMYSLNIEKLGNKSIEVTKFNENYFTNGKNVIMFTSQLFEDYKQHCLCNKKIVGIIEFLEDSVENNHYLSDYLEKCKFDVIENRVIIKESKNLSNDNSYETLGEFYFDNHSFTVTYGGYYFIENLSDKNEQYFYYGD